MIVRMAENRSDMFSLTLFTKNDSTFNRETG